MPKVFGRFSKNHGLDYRAQIVRLLLQGHPQQGPPIYGNSHLSLWFLCRTEAVHAVCTFGWKQGLYGPASRLIGPPKAEDPTVSSAQLRHLASRNLSWPAGQVSLACGTQAAGQKGIIPYTILVR